MDKDKKVTGLVKDENKADKKKADYVKEIERDQELVPELPELPKCPPGMHPTEHRVKVHRPKAGFKTKVCVPGEQYLPDEHEDNKAHFAAKHVAEHQKHAEELSKPEGKAWDELHRETIPKVNTEEHAPKVEETKDKDKKEAVAHIEAALPTDPVNKPTGNTKEEQHDKAVADSKAHDKKLEEARLAEEEHKKALEAAKKKEDKK